MLLLVQADNNYNYYTLVTGWYAINQCACNMSPITNVNYFRLCRSGLYNQLMPMVKVINLDIMKAVYGYGLIVIKTCHHTTLYKVIAVKNTLNVTAIYILWFCAVQNVWNLTYLQTEF